METTVEVSPPLLPNLSADLGYCIMGTWLETSKKKQVKACKGEKKEEKTVEGLHHTELGGKFKMYSVQTNRVASCRATLTLNSC